MTTTATPATATPSTKSNRMKFGQANGPLAGTSILVKPLDPAHFGGEANAVLVLNTKTGMYTSVNIYGPKGNGHFGKNYDPSVMTHVLPAEGSDRRKKWRKDGYVEGKISDFPDTLTTA